MKTQQYIPKPGERVPAGASYVPACGRLLDVGCGDGIISHFVKDRVKNIYGIDNIRSELVKSRRMGMTVKFADLDRQAIPFGPGFFDCVTCLDVIEHVRDPEDMLRKIRKVLKKNGILVITTPNIRFTNHIAELVFKGNFPKTSTDTALYDGGHLHFFTYHDLISLMEKTGFRVEMVDGLINKPRRGWKGRILEFIFGKKLMLEFRAQGILLVGRKSA